MLRLLPAESEGVPLPCLRVVHLLFLLGWVALLDPGDGYPGHLARAAIGALVRSAFGCEQVVSKL